MDIFDNTPKSSLKPDSLIEVDERTHMTTDGKVVKHIKAVRDLGVRVYKQRLLRFYSKPIAREARRRIHLAFKILSGRVFHSDGEFLMNLKSELNNLVLQCEFLEGSLLAVDENYDILELSPITDEISFIIPSPECDVFMRHLIKSDQLIAATTFYRDMGAIEHAIWLDMILPVLDSISKIMGLIFQNPRALEENVCTKASPSLLTGNHLY